MWRRPQSNESEDELLRQQEEFFKSQGKILPSSSILPVSKNEDSLSYPEPKSIVGEIVEKSSKITLSPSSRNINNKGFPSPFYVPVDARATKGPKRKSLFALQMESKKMQTEANILPEKEEMVIDEIPVIDKEVHEENLNKISTMSPEEIMEAKRSLEASLSPELLALLKARGAKKKHAGDRFKEEEVDVKPVEVAQKAVVDLEDIQSKLNQTVDEKWLEMDAIEPEKLQWIGDIPDAKALDPGQPYSARFNFEGDLQPFQTEVDVRTSLFHHGEEPERPGYTIQELYQLSRSSVLQQRILALTSLGNIIHKTKMGYYDSCFDGALLNKLVESEVFFLLRFAMDDKSTTSAAVFCLHELVYNHGDEVCLDRLLSLSDEEFEPFMLVHVEMDKDTEEGELTDDVVIAQDLVKGIHRTDLLVRFGYLLSNYQLDSVTVSNIYEIVQRVARHSPDASQTILDSRTFMSHLINDLNSSNPKQQAVKLLRILASSSKNNAEKLSSIIDFNVVLKIVDLDQPLFKVKLECLALWRCFLRHGYMWDCLDSFAPCIMRLLFFYVEKVDVTHGKFDFELFSSIVSVLNISVKHKKSVDAGYQRLIQVCLEKWLIQLTREKRFIFSVSKAVGSAFAFLVDSYNFFGVSKNDLEFLDKLSPVLALFMKTLGDLGARLLSFSHILNVQGAHRDPENLPSLCSIYKNGCGYLKIVDDQSVLPLFKPLADFLRRISLISKKYDSFLVLYSEIVGSYFLSVVEANETSNWFAKYEVSMLLSMLHVLKISCHSQWLKYSFRILSHFRSDDVRVLEIFDILSSALETFKDAFIVYRRHFENGLKALPLFSGENVASHWMYEPISVAPQQILHFLTFIMKNHSELIHHVPVTLKFCHLCLVLLNGENVFDENIRGSLEQCFDDVVAQFDNIDLNSVTLSEKPFYDLYRELVTEYAGSSYGDHLFGKIILLPLAQKFDVCYRKLMWSEFMHVLRVVTLPKDIVNFIPISVFASPVESDESLLVLYLNAVSKNVLSETRNGFIYAVAVENIRKYMVWEDGDRNLKNLLGVRINQLTNDSLKQKLGT